VNGVCPGAFRTMPGEVLSIGAVEEEWRVESGEKKGMSVISLSLHSPLSTSSKSHFDDKLERILLTRFHLPDEPGLVGASELRGKGRSVER